MADQLPDIRLSTGFPTHRKTKQLEKRCGAEGFRSLVILICAARCNRPDGDLTGMSDEDIETDADWRGEDGKFITALRECGWLDGKSNGYKMHDWDTHQPWSIGTYERSLAGYKANLQKQIKDKRISAEDAVRLLKRREKSLRKAQAEGLPPASAALTEGEPPAGAAHADREPAASPWASPSPSPSPSPLPDQALLEIEREGAGRESATSVEKPPKRPKPPSRKKPETELPASFGVSERVRAWAAEKGFTQLEQRLEHFTGYARAKAKRYADWDQAFMNSIRDDWAKLGTANPNGKDGGTLLAKPEPMSLDEKMRRQGLL